MSQHIPARPNPDRKAAKTFERTQRAASRHQHGGDPNAQFLGEQSTGGGGSWVFLVHRITRRLIVGR